MAFEEEKPDAARPPRARKVRVEVVPARGRIVANPEVRVASGWLEVTLFTPEIAEGKFRYSISKRYLLVWADGSPHAQHQFVILPKPVDPEQHEVRFANGVVEARIRLRKT